VNEYSFIFAPVRPRDEIKEQSIRDKAVEIIVKEGFDGLSMQKLAKIAGVSPATIYIYFKDREDLIARVTSDEGHKLSKAMLEGFDPKMAFEDGLRKQWDNRANYFLNNPMKMQFLEQIRNSPALEKNYKVDSSFIEAMREFAHNAIERKELIQLPIEVFWSVAYAPLYQLIKFHLAPYGMGPNHGKFKLDEESKEKALQLVLKALRP
jgi:TetR/AcrR family transcriptional repressor of multidrug resistance operon